MYDINQEVISGFQKEYRFLSNFVPAKVIYDDVEYFSVEVAFQAAKTLNIADRLPFQHCTSAQAKRLGRQLTLQGNWHNLQISVMYKLVLQKFSQPHFKKLLLATNKSLLVEENYWNDRFWGVCKGVGRNYLGRILMLVRHELITGKFEPKLL